MTIHRMAHILLDIEGTTSSIDYVYNVMFPYVRTHLHSFLEKHWGQPNVQKVCHQMALDKNYASFTDWCHAQSSAIESRLIEHEVIRLMDGDVKSTGLKQLQGLIWKDGFESGVLVSHLFEEVPEKLKEWYKQGIVLSIYSSGSVEAQKLFFGHTQYGNLLGLIHRFYDTQVGSKKESSSYRSICNDLGILPASVLFISDSFEELEAAKEAGLETLLSIRPGNPPISLSHTHPAIHDFLEIQLEKKENSLV